MFISSTDNNKIKEIKKLITKKGREKQKSFIVEGEHLVNEAYKKGLLKTLIVLENTNFSLDVETLTVTIKVMKSISNLDNPCPIMGIVKKVENNLIGNKILMLDDIQDPGNLGTIIRSACAFNVDTLVLSKGTVDVYNDKVIRATQGMLFNINIVIADLKELIKDLISKNYKIYGTNVINGKKLKSIEKSKKFAIIMGNEGKGISEEISKMCSEFIYIPMNNNCESLNVAVATSIILYELDN